MILRAVSVLLGIIGLLLFGGAPLSVAASLAPQVDPQPAGKVGLVIVAEDGTVRTSCVAIDAPEVTGYDVLVASGAEIEVEMQGAGAAVCRIDESGCPGNDCFCKCSGGECVYWSYWHLVEGNWQFSMIGASSYRVVPGDVEGWAWGPGSITNAVPPPVLTFDEICGDDTGGTDAAAESAASATAADATVTPAVTTAPAKPPQATPTTTIGAADDDGGSMTAYIGLVFVLAVLFATWLALKNRQRGGSNG